MNQLSLHDSLSLGEVEEGLEADQHSPSIEEIHRLPILLRLLSTARPLSAIPTSFLSSGSSNKSSSRSDKRNVNNDTASNDSTKNNNNAGGDELIDEAVARLEDVAATYSMAEGVDVVTCHLAPSICRRISRLNPLKRQKETADASDNNAAMWDVEELSMVSSEISTAASGKKRNRDNSNETGNRDKDGDEIRDGALSDAGGGADSANEAENKSHMALDMGYPSRPSKKRRKQQRLPGANASFADSQESMVTKTLSELSTLTVSSLEPFSSAGGSETSGEGNLSLSIEDSILAEAKSQQQTKSSVGSSCDLAATVAALMHHAPVLRHHHVANAICRAALPQAANLISRMGANCPSGVPSLLNGCIEAYNSANEAKPRNIVISNCAKSAVRALGELSEREGSRVRTALQYSQVMVDVQLELAMRKNTVAATCLLVENLSGACAIDTGSTNLTPSKENDAFRSGIPIPDSSTPPSASANKVFEDKKEQTTQQQILEQQEDAILLENILQHNSKLLETTLQFLKKELTAEANPRNWGRACLLLSALSWLFFRVQMKAMLENKSSGIQPVTSMIPALESLAVEIKKNAKEHNTMLVDDSYLDRPFNLLLCAILLVLAKLIDSDLCQENDLFIEACQKCLKELLGSVSISRKTDVMVSRFASFLKTEDIYGLQILVEEILSTTCAAGDCDRPGSYIDETAALNEGFLSTCKWASKHLDLDALITKGTEKQSVIVDQCAVIEIFQNEYPVDEENASRVREILKELLNEGDKSSVLVLSENIADFIIKATSFLVKSSKPNVPVISSMQVEALGSRVDLSNVASVVRNIECQFLLQLLYWLVYIDQDPNSPFIFDMRNLSLKEVYHTCQMLANNHLRQFQQKQFPVVLHIIELIERLFPEVATQARGWIVQNQCRNSFLDEKTTYQTSIKKMLSSALRFDAKSDPNCLDAESLFLLAKSQLSDADLCTTTASALLSSPNTPLPSFTYTLLSSDPLVLLKCPMRIWFCPGLRHVLMSLLFLLLETNDAVVARESPTTAGADDLIACRNVLLIRCLLAAATGSQDNGDGFPPISCVMITNLIRHLVAKNKGLIGMLVKQSLPDPALDWLVEHVPETMDDSQALNNVLLEQVTLTATEKLTAADAIVRIAVAHGHRDSDGTVALVYAALAQLVASFFLVVGPVGVPVNALVGEGSGLDITQISRKATFRILESLLRVRGRRKRLRTECSLALQKLAGLCKSESVLSGVTGAVENRRKNLLREIYSAVCRAASAMGSGIDV